MLLSADRINKVENKATDMIFKGKKFDLLAERGYFRKEILKTTLFFRVQLIFILFSCLRVILITLFRPFSITLLR